MHLRVSTAPQGMVSDQRYERLAQRSASHLPTTTTERSATALLYHCVDAKAFRDIPERRRGGDTHLFHFLQWLLGGDWER